MKVRLESDRDCSDGVSSRVKVIHELPTPDRQSLALGNTGVGYEVALPRPPGRTLSAPFTLRLFLAERDGLRFAGQANLSSSEPVTGFHFLDCCSSCAILLSDDTGENDQCQCAADQVRNGDFVYVTPKKNVFSSSSLASDLGQVTSVDGKSVTVEFLFQDGARSETVSQSRLQRVEHEGVLAFNTCTLATRLPSRVSRNLLFPGDVLGSWLLNLPGNYAYASSLDQNFVVRMFMHGLFVLPGDDTMFACPLPVTPYVFFLQEPTAKNILPASSMRRSKMLRRYRNDFELSCNVDFPGHLSRCGAFHQTRGGTWISNPLVNLLVEIHRDPSNNIKMYAFELWDKKTGELVAVSFSLSIGSFVHDFSMSCLVRDRRAGGAVLSKAIGSLLSDCGAQLWYWGCKVPYMAEYEAHGAREIPRSDYYRRVQEAAAQPLRLDPAEAIRTGKAEIACRSCGSSGL